MSAAATPAPTGGLVALRRAVSARPDPVGLFRALSDGGGAQGTLLLESADTTTARGERSLIVVRSCLRLAGRGRTVEVEGLTPTGHALLATLRDRFADYVVPGPTCDGDDDGDVLVLGFPPPATGDEQARLEAPSPLDAVRAVVTEPDHVAVDATERVVTAGVLSFDLLAAYEPVTGEQEDPVGWPDFELWVPDRLVWLDHRLGRASVVAFHGREAAGDAFDAQAGIAEMTRTIEETAAEGGPTFDTAAVGDSPAEPAPDPIHVDLTDEQYARGVTELKEHIVAGDVFQIVPSRTFSLPCPDPLRAYTELRALNPSPYMFYVNGRHGTVFGASPETAVKVDGQPLTVEIRPIAGTRRRARHPDGAYDHDQDSRLEAELRLDEKELAEHMMLVDLARNDVARVSEPGSRWVDRLLTVERYSHVMHLVSNVRGQLRADLDALHAYVATMNMGTLVGAPKIRAAQLLRRYEKTRRGPYGGAIGYLAADGRMDSSIVIRSATVRDGVAYVRAGAGVVFDSDPMAEADETRRKAEAVLQAIRRAAAPDVDGNGGAA